MSAAPSSSAGGTGEKMRTAQKRMKIVHPQVPEVTDRVTLGQQGRAWDCNPPAKEMGERAKESELVRRERTPNSLGKAANFQD